MSTVQWICHNVYSLVAAAIFTFTDTLTILLSFIAECKLTHYCLLSCAKFSYIIISAFITGQIQTESWPQSL